PGAPGRAAGVAGRPRPAPPGVGNDLPALPGVRRAAAAGERRREQLLRRPGREPDRAGHQRHRAGGERPAGLAADLRAAGAGGAPALGIAGGGWATVAGSSVSALLALGLMLRPRFRAAYATASGWRLDPALLGRLLRFSVPNGVFVALDTLGFAIFTQLVGRL